MDGAGSSPEQSGQENQSGGDSPFSSQEASSKPISTGEQSASQLLQPGSPQTEKPKSVDAGHGRLVEERSSNQPLNMSEILQQEFGLTNEKLGTLKTLAKEKGIDLERFSEKDLGNKEKIQQVLDLLEDEKMELSEQQKANLEKIKQQIQQADQPLTSEQIQAKITERKQQLQSRIEQLQSKQQRGEALKSEEQEELKQSQEALVALTEMEGHISQSSNDQSPEARVQRNQTLLEKVPTYFKYAGFGLAALFFIFAWKGLTSEMGGQRG